jgi:hypothetical protein
MNQSTGILQRGKGASNGRQLEEQQFEKAAV